VETLPNDELCSVGSKRLDAGEYPESVACDLRTKGISENELQALFANAAARQRRKGLIRIVAGVLVSVITLFIVLAAHEAGISIYGPGLAIGLVILARGFLRVRNASEIANVIGTN